MVAISPDEKQLVEIAKALAKDPQILLLDEPTASLDFRQVEALFSTIRALKSRGVAIVFISHRMWEVAKICDRLVAFRNGETVGGLDFSVQARDENLIVPLITGQAARGRVRQNRLQREEEIAAFAARGTALEMQGVSLPDGRLKDISSAFAGERSWAWAGCRGRGRRRSS